MRHQRPAPADCAAYYHKYIDRVPDGDVVATLEAQLGETLALFRSVPDEILDRGYAPGKWMIRQVVGHIADTERVMACRALRVARGDATPLPGFDENTYAETGRFGARSMDSLLDELTAVRRATVALLAGVPEEAWQRSGTASGHPVTARALAWIIAGHERHHAAIVRERYLGAAPAGS